MRQIDEGHRILNLFQGQAPVEPVSRRGSVYPGDRRIHAPAAVSVQIHDLDIADANQQLLNGNVPAVAVWLPDFMRVGVFEEMAD